MAFKRERVGKKAEKATDWRGWEYRRMIK